MGKSNWEEGSVFSDGEFKAIRSYEGDKLVLREVNEKLFQEKRKKLLEESYTDEYKALRSNYNFALKCEEELANKIQENEESASEEELANLQRLQAERKKAEDAFNAYKKDHRSELLEQEKKCTKEASTFAANLNSKYWAQLNAREQREHVIKQLRSQKEAKRKLEDSIRHNEVELLYLEEQKKAIEESGDSEEDKRTKIKAIDNDIAKSRKEMSKSSEDLNALTNSINENQERKNKLDQIALNAQLSFLDASEQTKLFQEMVNDKLEEQAEIKQQMADIVADAQAKGMSNEEIAADGEIQKQLDVLTEALESSKNATKELEKSIQTVAGKTLTAQRKADNEAKKRDLQARKDALKSKEGRQALQEEGALAHEEEAVNKQEQSQRDFGKDMAALKDGTMAMNAGIKVLNNISESIDNNISSMYEYQGYLEARLQESGITGKKAIRKVVDIVGMSGIVQQKDVVNKIKEAVDHGIAYNVELRAFLAATAENIATTFDAFDANLLRLIKVQQADTTAARLGMEASLTKLFNSTFKDSSYLTDAADAVAGAILDASSQLTKEQSLEFEYIVQKWLGALYSVGLSQDAVNTIAEGINYLGTGNVDALNSNETLQRLLAMSASQGGLPYAEMLTEGLDASKTNDLLKSMVKYLQTIAQNSDNNQVTKQAYTNLFGISMSDLQAINNLTAAEIENLHSNVTSYGDALNETNNQLGKLYSRIHISQIIENAFQNIMTSTAANIGGTAIGYGLWKTLNVVEGLTGGINIPAIGVMGNMVDLDTTITGIAKTGIVGLGLIGSVLGGIGSMFLGGATKLDRWGDIGGVITHGSAKSNLKSGFTEGTSESADLVGTGNASGDDVKTTSLSDQTKSAEEDSKITNKSVEGKGQTELQKIVDAVYESESITVLSTLLAIKGGLDNVVSKIGVGGGGGASGGSGSSGAAAVGGFNIDDLCSKLSDITFKVSGISPLTSAELDACLSNLSLGSFLTKADLEDVLNNKSFSSTLSVADIQNLANSSIFKVEVLSITSSNSSTDIGGNSSIVGGTSTNNNTSNSSLNNSTTSGNNNQTNNSNNSNPLNSLVGPSMSTIIDTTSLLTPLQEIVTLLDINRVFKTDFDISPLLNTQTSNSNANITSTAMQIENAAITIQGGASQLITDTITQLSAQVISNTSATSMATNNSSNSLNVTVDKVGSEFIKALHDPIANAVLHALSAHHDNIDKLLIEMIKESIISALGETTVSSNITNDYFNEWLLKQAFIT